MTAPETGSGGRVDLDDLDFDWTTIHDFVAEEMDEE